MTDDMITERFNAYRLKVLRLVQLYNDDRQSALAELGHVFVIISYIPPGHSRGIVTNISLIESVSRHVIPNEYEYEIDERTFGDPDLWLRGYTPPICDHGDEYLSSMSQAEYVAPMHNPESAMEWVGGDDQVFQCPVCHRIESHRSDSTPPLIER